MRNAIANLIRLGAAVALLVALAACGTVARPDAAAGDTEAAANTVHMSNNRFVPEATTIAAGESLALLADTFAPHVIANGTWAGDSPQPGAEPGAPVVADLRIEGNGSGTIGPFPEVGTFQFYCPIHPGMNLAVTVE